MRTHIRKRGTAIVETNNGILVVAGKDKKFLLSGGGTDKGEMRVHAAMRELFEETGLKSISAEPIFHYEGIEHNGYKGKFKDIHTVCIVKTKKGNPYPRNEIKFVDFYSKDKNINLSYSTREIIREYFIWKEEQRNLFNKVKRLFKRKIFHFKKPAWRDTNPPKWARNILDKKAIPNGIVKVKGRNHEYSLKLTVGNIQGETDWNYMKRKLIK